MAESTNILNLEELQHYVNSQAALRNAVGAPQNTPIVLEPFAQGEYNANYAFSVTREGQTRNFLFRVNLGSQMHLDNQIEYEFEALRILAPSGRVPAALFVDGSCSQLPFGVGVEELLPGRPLRYEEDLDEAAHIFADIHAVEVPNNCTLLRPAHPVAAIVEECAQMFAKYRAWSQADSALIARIDALFKRAEEIAQQDRSMAAPTRVHVVNTEVNSSNFLINPGATSYLIDWEKPVLGEVEQDLAHFLVPTTTYWKTDTRFTRSDVEGFVEKYVRAVNGRFPVSNMQQRLESYLIVTCLRGLTWCAMAYTEYVGGGRAAENASTFAKIKEYLQDDFLTLVEQEYY